MNQLPVEKNPLMANKLRPSHLLPSMLAFVAATWFLLPAALAADTTITEPPCLWVATAGTKALAIDTGTRQVWLRTPETMTLFDAEGVYQMNWDLPSEGQGKSHLVTLPTDDSIWIAEDTFLESFGIGPS